MDNKKLLLGLTVLATPFVLENITEENVASANQTVATQKQTTQQYAKSSEYVLNKPAKAYLTSNDAAQRVNQKATYQAGTYYVYNQNKGMVNISKATGKAGSWINPTDSPNAKKTTQTTQVASTTTANKTQETPQKVETTTTQTPKSTNLSLVPPKAGQYSVLKTTDAYVNAIDASKKVNAKGKVSAGNYYIFREYKGMLNVSRTQGKVGSWINPGATVIADVAKPTTTTNTTTPKTSTVTETKPATQTQEKTTGYKTNGMFTLVAPTEAYMNAIDASKKANARGRVAAGSYHIFREYKGMLNVSRAQGKAGSWINPGLVEEPKTSVSTTETKPTTPVQTTSQETKPTSTTQEKTVGYKSNGMYSLTVPTEAYVNAADASKKTNARGKIAAGSYHIFREYKGMLNVSKYQGKAGSWINPGVVETKTSTPTPTQTVQKETKPTSTTQEKTVGYKSNGMFVVANATEAYVSSADASKKVNARGKVAAGSYHIFREYNGMLNISKAKGKVGSWINPNGKVVETSTTKLPETASASKEVSGAGVTYYKQDDARWGSKRYGISNMKHAGCVPTSLAMAISTLGTKVSPVTIADYLYNNTSTFNKYYEGTTSDGIPAVLNRYGLKYKVLNTKAGLQSELGKGNVVLSLVQGADFVTPGYTHAVVAKGLDSVGKTTVYNPLSKWGVKKFTTDKLFNSQSMDKIDRTLGGTFISIFK